MARFIIIAFIMCRPQLKWMRADLAKVDRTRTPWVIVLGHRAMYCTKNTDPECNSEAEHIRNGYPLIRYSCYDCRHHLVTSFTISKGVEELLLEYGADLYVAGHTHHYMRTWPVKKDQLMQENYTNPAGPIHVQSGIGGVDGDDPFSLPMRPIDAWRDMNYTQSFSNISTSLISNRHSCFL